MEYIFLILTFLSSLILTYVIRKIAIDKSIIDNPNDRSSHTVPTPRGGGLAIVISFYLAVTYYFIIGNLESRLFYALLSGIPLIIISIIDDIISLSPKIRFITQFISSALALFFLNGLQTLDLGFIQFNWVWPLTILCLFGMIWFINLYNFIDGIDGYASMEAIFVSSALYYFTKNEITLILAIATLGFIPWNWQRAKIFMGDVGSTIIGFILIVLGIYFQNKGEFSFVNWLILTSLFWFDATFTLYRRWRNKEQLSVAHRKHAFQRIVQAGFSHQKTLIFGLIIDVILLGLILITFGNKFFLIYAFIPTILILFLITIWIDKRKPFDKIIN